MSRFERLKWHCLHICIFSTSGDTSGTTTVFNKRLTYLLSLKKEFRVVLWLVSPELMSLPYLATAISLP